MHLIASRLTDLAGFVSALADLPLEPEVEGVMRITDLELDLPIELEVRLAAGDRLEIDVALPAQQIETTMMPVFHRMRLEVTTKDAPR